MRNRLILAGVAACGISGVAYAGGACTASVDNGVLLVTCDDLANDIVIYQDGGDTVVEGNDGEAINGGAAAVFSEAVDHIVVDLNGGEDLSEIAEVDISGDIHVSGGEDRNEFLLIDSVVGGSVHIDNKNGGSETDFEGSEIGGDVHIRNHVGIDEVKIDGTVIEGDVTIDNGDGAFDEDEGIIIGGITDVESGAEIQGNLTILNKLGYDELGIEESVVEGDVWVDNSDGDLLSGDGSSTDIEDFSEIGGSLTLIAKAGFDEFDLEEAGILGHLSLSVDGGGSGVDIEVAYVGGVSVLARGGEDALNLDDTIVDGDVWLDLGSGGSDFLTENGVEIVGDLEIQTKGGTDVVTLDDCSVEGDVTVNLGSGDDAFTYLNSTFDGDVSVSGHSGTDTLTDGGLNTVNGDASFSKFEIVLP